MTEVEKLKAKLLIHGIDKVHVFPGSNPNATEEQVAAAISASIDRLINGDYEEIE